MPSNKFPDSLEKRELRRQDARRLESFKLQNNLITGLSYCGMPSIEFLDIKAWRNHLHSVCALEFDSDNLADMRIEWDNLSLSLPIEFINADVLNYLLTTDKVFDIYNLDFYGGFVNRNKSGNPRCVEAIKNLINRQAKKQTSFILIATFNVRDTGAMEYLKFIDAIPKALKHGWENVEANCKAHRINNANCLKLCFPYFCWHVGMSNNFAVNFKNPVVYQSSATMLHFYAEFIYQPTALPTLTFSDVLVEIANRPLKRLKGLIEVTELRPPQILPTLKKN